MSESLHDWLDERPPRERPTPDEYAGLFDRMAREQRAIPADAEDFLPYGILDDDESEAF